MKWRALLQTKKRSHSLQIRNAKRNGEFSQYISFNKIELISDKQFKTES